MALRAPLLLEEGPGKAPFLRLDPGKGPSAVGISVCIGSGGYWQAASASVAACKAARRSRVER